MKLTPDCCKRRCSVLLLWVFTLHSGCVSAVRVPSAEERRQYEQILVSSVLLLRSGEYSRAEAGFELLLEINPGDPRGWDGLASAALRTDRRVEARRYLEYALTCDPRYDSAIAHYGLLEEVEEKPDLARKHYRTALRLNPLNRVARAGLARLSADATLQRERRKLEFVQALSR